MKEESSRITGDTIQESERQPQRFPCDIDCEGALTSPQEPQPPQRLRCTFQLLRNRIIIPPCQRRSTYRAQRPHARSEQDYASMTALRFMDRPRLPWLCAMKLWGTRTHRARLRRIGCLHKYRATYATGSLT